MPSATNNFVLFRTDLFLFSQEEKDCDRWFVGGDCAGWFYIRLLPVDGIRHDLEPIMEDWGWTFSLAVADVRVHVCVWAYFLENCWVLGIEPKQRRLFHRATADELQRAKDKVSAALDAIIARDARFLKHQWFAENPFDLVVREF